MTGNASENTGPMSAQEVEAVMAKRPFPRVTAETIKDKIASVSYMLDDALPVAGMTLCFITLTNGFVFLGKSVPADLRNFNPDIGRHFAYEDAFKQIWSHEGYLLKEKLHQARIA